MSLLMFWINPDGFMVVTDTLAVDDDENPMLLVSKAVPVPHLGMVAAGTGSEWVIRAVIQRLNNGLQCLDIEMADIYLPEICREQQAEAEDLGITSTTTIYTFGQTRDTGEYVAFAYRSTSDYESELLEPPAFGIKPGTIVQDWESPTTVDEILALAHRVRDEQTTGPRADRVVVGGDLIAIDGHDGLIITRRLGSLDDFDESWARMNTIREGQSDS